MNVPNVEFSSLNLVAPMSDPIFYEDGEELEFDYIYAGPSLTVQRITDIVAAQGSILPITAPSVNSTWNLDFNGPFLSCNPVRSEFRQAVLANILNYTTDCSYVPGYMAWHPKMMKPNTSMSEYLPFMTADLNSSAGILNNDNGYGNINGYGNRGDDMASVFLAIAPTLFNSSFDERVDPFMFPGEPQYQALLPEYYNTSTVLRCDVHNSTYNTTFSFLNGVQKVDINNVTDVTDTPVITTALVAAYFNPLTESDISLQPQACPPSDNETVAVCLFDRGILSMLSYQAVMNAFTNLVVGMISWEDGDDPSLAVTRSTTRLNSIILADAPELAFLQLDRLQGQNIIASVQQRAAMWEQQPFTGLVNAAVTTKSKMPFQQALEQLFQNITISLMSAPELQYTHHFLPLNNAEVPS